jgi:hypothetical protein
VLIATVLTTPDGKNQGVTFSSVSYGDITVAGGVVTASSLFFAGSNFSGRDNLSLSFQSTSVSVSEYYIYSSDYNLFVTGGATFSSATPVPFDFDPSFGVVALGGIWAGRKVIKKIKTSKKSV